MPSIGPRHPSVSADVQQASVGHALTLIQGWPKGDKSELEAALLELRQLSKHNAGVLEEAIEASKGLASRFKDLEAREAKVAKEVASLAERASAIDTKAFADQDRINGLSRVLANERKEFEDSCRVREGALRVREASALDRETKARNDRVTADTLNANAQALSRQAAERQGKMDTFVRSLRGILDTYPE